MSDFDGVRGSAGAWWRGWTPWVTALVMAALFAGATSGIAFVRRSYQPPVDYPAMNESELAASASASASSAGEPDRPKASPSTRPTGAPSESTPAKAPRKLRPSASGSASADEMTSEEPSESPFHPLGGLGALFGMDDED